jgi:hypothetical protein
VTAGNNKAMARIQRKRVKERHGQVILGDEISRN